MAKVEVSSSGTTRGRRGAVVEAEDGPPNPAVVSRARAGRAEVAVVMVVMVGTGSAGAFA